MTGKKIDVDRLDLDRMKIRLLTTPGLLPYAQSFGALIKPEGQRQNYLSSCRGNAQQTEYQECLTI